MSALAFVHELRCVHCGAPFAWRNARRRQCLDCEAERFAQTHREQQLRRYQRNKPATGRVHHE